MFQLIASLCSLVFLVLIFFGVASPAKAQFSRSPFGDMEQSSSASSQDYVISVEYKPLTALMFTQPGGSSYGGEVELKLADSFVLTAGYIDAKMQPNEEQYTKMQEKAKEDNKDEDFALRKMNSQQYTAGLRWYPERTTHSFYLGAKAIQTHSNLDYIYLEDAAVNEDVTTMGPAVEFGFRWLVSHLMIRLGLNGYMESNRKSKFTSTDDSHLAEEALAELDKEQEELKKKTQYSANIDLGLGFVF